MKNSIVFKIFRNTFLIFAILLLIQLFFQLFFFNNYFVRYKVNSLKEQLSSLVYDLENTSPSGFETIITQFADVTNSTNAVINTVQDDLLNDYNLTMITLTDDQQNQYNVLIPFNVENRLTVGREVSLNMIKHNEKDLYLSTTLTLQNKTYSIYENNLVLNDDATQVQLSYMQMSNNNKGLGQDKRKDKEDKETPGKGNVPPQANPDESDLNTTQLEVDSNVLYKILGDFNKEELIPLAGLISSINKPSYENETVFTMELMNYYLDKINGEIGNYELNNYTIDEQHTGTYYFSETDIGRNIVFINTIYNDDTSYELFTVVSLQQTDQIISLMVKFNYVLSGVILILLILSSLLHSKIISRPLLMLNKKANEIANLNFDTKVVQNPKRKDEIGQLSKSLDVVSANLSSSLHRLEEQNKQLKENLELENESEQIRKDFVAGLSHEIKTPLAVIQASSEALLEDIFTDPADQKNQLSVINKEVSKTNKLINEMVTVYRLDRPSYELQFNPFKLDELIESLASELKTLADTKNLSINLNLLSITTYGDQDKIEMVISNFMTNAIKYSNDNETITITLSIKNNSVLFEIENTGSYIDEEKLKHLFDPFYRLDNSRSRHLNSSGLGLYIVSLILNQHKSEYGAYNSDDGVIFYFTIEKVSNSIE